MSNPLSRSAAIFAIAATVTVPTQTFAEETNYAKLGRWSVASVTNGASLAYCSADIDNGKVQLRLTTDGKSWRVGVPYYENRKRVQGYFGFGDAAEAANFSVTGDGWAFIPIDGDQLEAFKINPTFAIRLDRGLQTWRLAGAAPALDKATECARNKGRTQQASAAASSPSSQAGSRPGRMVLSELRTELTCLMVQRPEKGARLVIGRRDECGGPNAQFVVGEYDVVQLAQAQNLCIASSDRANVAAFIGECENASLLSYDKSNRAIGAIAGESLCLGLQGRPSEEQIASGQVFITETCSRSRDQKILFEAGDNTASPRQTQAQPLTAGAPAAPGGLSAGSFRPISSADLSSWSSSSGCSFSLSRGKDLLVLFDTQDPKKTALFKIDGKLIYARAGVGGAPGGYWAGSVAGHTVRLIKGKRDPKFKNDGGGEGGDGRLEWIGPGGQGSLPLRWQEGC